ncbi:Hypothetical predicted protein [Podarcis lilfordi]|uniref:Uncharacterized protein n=1 Tax=Podarcis lilfordi TaxID=74358 RepID=A0AA35K5Y7_9SAUR|nr:Hypothetical predicted protein [Podarcis lilfordi]
MTPLFWRSTKRYTDSHLGVVGPLKAPWAWKISGSQHNCHETDCTLFSLPHIHAAAHFLMSIGAFFNVSLIQYSTVVHP